MASPLDKPARKVSRTLIRKFGVPVTFTLKGTPGTYNATTRKAADPGDAGTVATRALVAPHKARVQQRGATVGGDVRLREAEWTVPALDFSDVRPPRTGDQGTLGGNTFKVLGVDPVYSGELVAFYNVHVKA